MLHSVRSRLTAPRPPFPHTPKPPSITANTRTQPGNETSRKAKSITAHSPPALKTFDDHLHQRQDVEHEGMVRPAAGR